MLGTRFVATVEGNIPPAYRQAIIAAHAKDTALTNCFQDGWPAMHRALRNCTFAMWDAAGCPPPGKRPGEGDVLVSRPDGTKIRRYWYKSPVLGDEGTITECALYAGRSVGPQKCYPLKCSHLGPSNRRSNMVGGATSPIVWLVANRK
jgi:nitronate monooxygenase